ncbi:MAG: SusD/RagB family nutrient-binding outer membrane lipoprotein [Cyclobacteriaceae bacterium]
MKTYKFIFTTFVSLFALSACDDMLDINQDPARISPEQVTLQTLLPAAERYTATCFFGAAQYGGLYPQYTAGQQIDQYTPYGMDQLWRPFYLNALPTLQELIERADSQGARNYAGIGRTLLALNLMMVADTWGDAPYTDANQGSDLLYPCYDEMQFLYEDVLSDMLDQAIEDLQAPLPELPSLSTVRGDYFYGGDLSQWLKAAYGARARYHLHLAEQNPALLSNAVEDARRSFDSPAGEEDLQMIYDEQVQNPWFSFIGNPVNKIMQPSSYIMNLMNGTGYYEELPDPRISAYADNGSADGSGDYIGTTPGTLVGENPEVNVNITTNTFFADNTSPLLILTTAEMKFILAEALFASDRNAAYEAYLEGIEVSMRKVGVSEDELSNYLSDPQISMGATNLALRDIMVQKYIALYLQIETWTDLRRYQYDNNVYPDLTGPVTNQIDPVSRPWVQRANIADDEPGRNTCIPEVENQAQVLWLFQ